MKKSSKRASRPLNQIAVPTDFYPASTSAMQFAERLAKIPRTNRVRASAIVMGVRGGGDWERATTHIPWALAHRIIAGTKYPVLTIRG
jgi:hypothetical protein